MVGWLSAPFAPPLIYAVTVEADARMGLSGEVRHRPDPRLDARAHQLALGRALSRGHITRLAAALADVSAVVRAHAAGPVAEAIRVGTRVDAIEHGECDYWNAYELADAVGLIPDDTWRRETRRARRWLGRHWIEVGHLASRLLSRPAGRRTLAGAALTQLIASARRRVAPRYDAAAYEPSARALLAAHRRRWQGRAHWVVVERGRPRGTGVAWAEDEGTAARLAAALADYSPSSFDLQRR